MINSAKKELFERIIRAYPNLSPKKRVVADFILNDYKSLFLTNAKELAQTCGVSEPTVMRFVMDLGFNGFGEFEQYVKGLLHIELTSVERLLKTSQTAQQTTTLEAYVRNTVGNLENMVNTVSAQEVEHVARTLHASPSVLVAGYRASAVLASYFGYLLRKVRSGVQVDTAYLPDTLDQIAAGGSSMALFLIAFPRYPRRAIELIEYAKYYDVQIIGLSDTPKSPIVTLADHFLIIDMEGLSFVDPFSHVITFLGALIHEIAFIDKAATVKRLSRIEDGVRRREEFYSVETVEPPSGHDPLDPSYYGINLGPFAPDKV